MRHAESVVPLVLHIDSALLQSRNNRDGETHCHSFYREEEPLRVSVRSSAPAPPCPVVRSSIHPVCVRMYADAEARSDQHTQRQTLCTEYVFWRS